MSFLCLLGVSALSVFSLCVSAQQRMCEQLTRVVDIVVGLPPFQATFEKAPISERLVIVMALGPYAVQWDTSGHIRAQFLNLAAANSADLLRLSVRCPLPQLMLQAAQLGKTQIEEFILNCHQAGQEWDCVCLVDEIFNVGASHMSVFDEVPENSVFITQPHLRKDQTRPTNALPSMLVWTGGQHDGLQAIPGVPKWHTSIKLAGGKIATLQATLVTAKWCGAWRKPGFF